MNIKNKISIIIFCLGVVLIIIGVVVSLIPNLSSTKEQQKEKWILNGSTVTKGENSYKIGDYYEYDESNGGVIEGLTDVKWKVMGVDNNGNLLILSASNIDGMTLGKQNDLETSQKDYIEGISRLNDLAKKYGTGNGALDARSITAEDINKITGYKPNVESDGYNSKTTYYWTDSENPKYESSTYGTEIMNLSHSNSFVWYDQTTKTWMSSEKTGKETSDNPTKITTLVNTLYAYDNSKYNAETDSFDYLLEEDSLEFKMLYLDDDGNNANYWTADAFVAANSLSAYGYSAVKRDALNYTYIVYSPGITRETTAGVRAVVTID